MSNRKEIIKKTLGISEYPWSSDDDEETTATSGQNACPLLQHQLPAARPSVADMPGTSGASSSDPAAPLRLPLGSSSSQQSRAQAKLDRNMFWSLLNNPQNRMPPVEAPLPRIPDIPSMSRTTHTPAAELREASNERASSASDIRRIMAFKKLTRSLSSRPSKTALNLYVQRSSSSSSMRQMLSQPRTNQALQKRLQRLQTFQAHNSNVINNCRSRLNLLINPSGGEAASTSGSRPAPETADFEPSNEQIIVNVNQSDEEMDIFSSTRMDGLTNEENHENSETVAEAHDTTAGGVSLEEEIVEIEAEPALPADEQRDNNEHAEPSGANNETVNNDASEEQPQGSKRRRSANEDDDDGCTMKEFNQRLLRVLECPVCMEWVGAPVSQCRRGHVLCAACRARLSACPVCRTAFSSVRNRAMEQVAELLRYPCRHGCGRELRWRRRGAHEASCPARRYPCPAPACAARAPLHHRDLPAHLHSKHGSQVKVGRSHKFSMRVNSEQHSHWFIMALQEIFHLRVDVDIRTWGVVIYVAYIGPKCKAKNYSYEVSVSGQHNCRKLVYTRCAHSDLESSSLNVSRQDCFHLTLDQAMNFLRFKNRHCEPDKFLDFNVEITNTSQEVNDSDS